LDEPISGLDITAGLVFRELVTRLAAEGKIILCSSHELSLVENVCSEVVILHRGRVVARGSIEELRHLRNQPSLEAVFSDLVASDNIESVAGKMLELVMDT
jgi:ABC-2 type transport system ATP-binding protein